MKSQLVKRARKVMYQRGDRFQIPTLLRTIIEIEAAERPHRDWIEAYRMARILSARFFHVKVNKFHSPIQQLAILAREAVEIVTDPLLVELAPRLDRMRGSPPESIVRTRFPTCVTPRLP